MRLRSAAMFEGLVSDVLPVYISNSKNSFISGLTRSTFAIVYHTKKRGRLNIANVTDSLYDDELDEMSSHLGRNNVVVLVDDVEDSSDENMRRLTQEQRLGAYACEVILISEWEKEMEDSLDDKLHDLKKIIERSLQNDAGPNKAFYGTLSESSYGSNSKGFQSLPRSSPPSPGSESRGPRSDRPDMPDDPLVTLLPGQNPHIPTPQNNIGKEQKKKKREKMVFGIIGGLIIILLIVLIIVLCVTL
ncbi:uncharacterized protein RB166_015272 [Leptodactylus fuscus]|uniref:uncharacterized protein LOC142216293 n=1 Tax=Leptodactylus fuscus TaxID=238119 RepID=UPI003F4E7711